MSEIRLHPTLGLNPKITTCPICRKDSGLVMLGIANYYDECAQCGIRVYGGIKRRSPCPKCKCEHGTNRTYLDEHEKRIPVSMVCSECAEHMKTRIALILVERTDQGPKYLGPMVWIKEEVWKEISTGPEAEQSIRQRVALLTQDVWGMIGLPNNPEDSKEDK